MQILGAAAFFGEDSSALGDQVSHESQHEIKSKNSGKHDNHVENVAKQKTLADCLGGLKFVVTGTMKALSREQVEDLILQHGGKVVHCFV